MTWRDQAACLNADPESFFPEQGERNEAAKAVCATCPVTAECLQHALDNDERWGVWGGMSEHERQKLRTRRYVRASKAECGTPAGYQRHKRASEDACAACRQAHSSYIAEHRTPRRKAS